MMATSMRPTPTQLRADHRAAAHQRHRRHNYRRLNHHHRPGPLSRFDRFDRCRAPRITAYRAASPVQAHIRPLPRSPGLVSPLPALRPLPRQGQPPSPDCAITAPTAEGASRTPNSQSPARPTRQSRARRRRSRTVLWWPKSPAWSAEGWPIMFADAVPEDRLPGYLKRRERDDREEH
jgi:hypothetical protein